jgi:hypothetical protein
VPLAHIGYTKEAIKKRAAVRFGSEQAASKKVVFVAGFDVPGA